MISVVVTQGLIQTVKMGVFDEQITSYLESGICIESPVAKDANVKYVHKAIDEILDKYLYEALEKAIDNIFNESMECREPVRFDYATSGYMLCISTDARTNYCTQTKLYVSSNNNAKNITNYICEAINKRVTEWFNGIKVVKIQESRDYEFVVVHPFSLYKKIISQTCDYQRYMPIYDALSEQEVKYFKKKHGQSVMKTLAQENLNYQNRDEYLCKRIEVCGDYSQFREVLVECVKKKIEYKCCNGLINIRLLEMILTPDDKLGVFPEQLNNKQFVDKVIECITFICNYYSDDRYYNMSDKFIIDNIKKLAKSTLNYEYLTNEERLKKEKLQKEREQNLEKIREMCDMVKECMSNPKRLEDIVANSI